jgi:hypothetical protein
MTRGQGSLLVATRSGVRLTGVVATAAPRPTQMWWAHLEACSWTAAWLTARGRHLQGSREVAADPSWRGELKWRDAKGRHKSGHRPDLAWRTDRGRVAIEVELARKWTPRLEAIIDLHARWRASGSTGGVIYVCLDKTGCERVLELAAERGLTDGRGGGLRVERLDVIKQQARSGAGGREASADKLGDDREQASPGA